MRWLDLKRPGEPVYAFSKPDFHRLSVCSALGESIREHTMQNVSSWFHGDNVKAVTVLGACGAPRQA